MYLLECEIEFYMDFVCILNIVRILGFAELKAVVKSGMMIFELKFMVSGELLRLPVIQRVFFLL